jgi:hypothetical protein
VPEASCYQTHSVQRALSRTDDLMTADNGGNSLRDAGAAPNIGALAVDPQLLQGVPGGLHEFGKRVGDRGVVEA